MEINTLTLSKGITKDAFTNLPYNFSSYGKIRIPITFTCDDIKKFKIITKKLTLFLKKQDQNTLQKLKDSNSLTQDELNIVDKDNQNITVEDLWKIDMHTRHFRTLVGTILILSNSHEAISFDDNLNQKINTIRTEYLKLLQENYLSNREVFLYSAQKENTSNNGLNNRLLSTAIIPSTQFVQENSELIIIRTTLGKANMIPILHIPFVITAKIYSVNNYLYENPNYNENEFLLLPGNSFNLIGDIFIKINNIERFANSQDDINCINMMMFKTSRLYLISINLKRYYENLIFVQETDDLPELTKEDVNNKIDQRRINQLNEILNQILYEQDENKKKELFDQFGKSLELWLYTNYNINREGSIVQQPLNFEYIKIKLFDVNMITNQLGGYNKYIKKLNKYLSNTEINKLLEQSLLTNSYYPLKTKYLEITK